MSLDKNLKQIRKKWRDTQTDFGDRFGVSKTAVSKWEMGQTEPSISVLIELAEMTGIPAKRLYQDVIEEKEVGSKPGEYADKHIAEKETKYKMKIADLVMEKLDVELEKVRVLKMLEELHDFLEQDLDKRIYRKAKKVYMEQVQDILAAGKGE